MDSRKSSPRTPRPKLRNAAGIFAYCQNLSCDGPAYCKGFCVKHYSSAARATPEGRAKHNAAARHWSKHNKEKKAARDRAYREKNRPALLQKAKERWQTHEAQVKAKAYKQKNKERINAYMKPYLAKYVDQNKEKIKAYKKAHRLIYEKENAEKIRDRVRRHRQENPARYRARVAARRAARIQATPPWSQFEQIVNFYLNCPEGYEADHILPLQGADICGLHVIDNLQYLPAAQNRSKGNKFDFTYSNTGWMAELHMESAA